MKSVLTILNKVSKIIFPFFPRASQLSSKSWRKLVWIINILFACFVLISDLLFLLPSISHYSYIYTKYPFLTANSLLFFLPSYLLMIPLSVIFPHLSLFSARLLMVISILFGLWLIIQIPSIIFRWLLFTTRMSAYITKIKSKGICLVIGIISSLLLIYLFHLLIWFPYWGPSHYYPSTWPKYSNTATSYHYSFSYPNQWVVNDCGNGEIVVSGKPVEKCLLPLDAPADYLENVYFQTFIPKNYDYLSSKEIAPPNSLTTWSTLYMYPEDNDFIRLAGFNILPEYSKMSGKDFPVKKEAGSKGSYNFEVGFYPHPEYAKELEWVRNSFEYDFKSNQ